MYSYKLSLEAEEDIVRIFEYGIGQFWYFKRLNFMICFLNVLTKLLQIL